MIFLVIEVLYFASSSALSKYLYAIVY